MASATTFEILPAIDLRAGRVVRLRQGDFAQETAYGDDPVEVARGFASHGARWLHVVDLDAARTGVPSNVAAVGAIIADVGDRIQVEVAGGIRDEAVASAAFATGAVRVVVGTAALRDPSFAGRLVAVHGANRIVVAIDVREGQAVGQGWSSDAVGIDVIEAITRLAEAGVAAFEVTAIDRDGLMGGPDLTLYERLVALERGSIIASGGIASLDDLRAVRAIGCTGAIVGRAIYEGRLDLAQAIALSDGSD
jgi:phosphoribosylformimino-5-aminoimidazole carboxamide ribotide isomerase